MEKDSPDFLKRLEEALSARAAWLETVRIPLLKDMMGTYRSLFESVIGTLVKKGLLREDPYDYNGQPGAVSVPPDSALPDSGLPEGNDTAEVSRRITSYRHQLTILLEGFPLTLAAMDPGELGRTSSLLSYVDWEAFGEQSHSPTTRALARLVTSVRLSKDGLSARVLAESQGQIEKLSKDIRERLCELETWQRESWKAQVRAKVLPRVTRRGGQTQGEQAQEMFTLRKAFELAMPGVAWHSPLAQEILDEDRSPGSAERKETLLVSLKVPPPPAPPKPQEAPSGRVELMGAIRRLCRTSEEIALCEEVLVQNEHAIEKRRLGFFQRLRRWFRRSLGGVDDRSYEIEYRASAAAEPRTEIIEFLRLISEMRELRALLKELAEEGSPASRRIEALDDAQLRDFLDWQLRQVRQIHRRMEGLNALFQVKAVEEHRGTARSIKLELLAIENGMVYADKVRRESHARLEKPARPDR